MINSDKLFPEKAYDELLLQQEGGISERVEQ